MPTTSSGVLPSLTSESHARATLSGGFCTFSLSREACSRLFCRCYDEVMNRRKRCSVEQRSDCARRPDGR